MEDHENELSERMNDWIDTKGKTITITSIESLHFDYDNFRLPGGTKRVWYTELKPVGKEMEINPIGKEILLIQQEEEHSSLI